MADTDTDINSCVLCKYKLARSESTTSAEHYHVISFTVDAITRAVAVKCPVLRPL